MKELFKLLDSLKDSTGDFACGGFLPELCLPGLVVENVGHISLPVQDEQAQKIIEVAKKAPFGLGAKTVIDETVRKTWQLDSSQVTIKNEYFLSSIDNIVAAVKTHLGCNKKGVQAKLYKVLLYEKGGHFKAHRDTEKEKGMFATLVVQLPSKFEGGKILVRHADKEKVMEMDGDRSAYCSKYAAHYSDCEHEVSEITSGYRLALVYSLCWTARGDPPSADTASAIVKKVAKVLPEICTGNRNLFSWFFSHKYSKTSFTDSGIDALKGGDASVARALQQANELLPENQKYEFYIAEVKRELQQFGDFWDENSWAGGFEPNGDEEEEIRIKNWFEFSGQPANLDVVDGMALDIETDVVNFERKNKSVKDAINQFWGEADKEDNTGPTGNEGAIQTYWYKSYAIFAWKKDSEIHLRCKLAGYATTVEWVSKRLKKVEKLDPSASEYKSVISDLKAVIEYAMSKHISVEAHAVYTMLETLSNVRDEAGILSNQFITDVMGRTTESGTSSPYCLGDGHIIPPLVKLTVHVGWASLSESLKKLLNISPVSQHRWWATFLKLIFQSSLKDVLQSDPCFSAMVKCLVEKVEVDAQNNLLDSAAAKNNLDRIASLLFAVGDHGNLSKFVNAIQAYFRLSPKTCLLQNLIRSLEREKLNGNQFWNQLLSLRIAQLEDVEKVGIPPFTWNQDNAILNGHPQVEAFLRGPTKVMKYQAFTGIAQARSFAKTYFGVTSSWVWPVRSTPPRLYTATATPSGTGRSAYVLIEKTTEWYDKKVAPAKQQLEELRKLRSMVNPVPVQARSSEAEQMEPQAKRRAVDIVCVD